MPKKPFMNLSNLSSGAACLAPAFAVACRCARAAAGAAGAAGGLGRLLLLLLLHGIELFGEIIDALLQDAHAVLHRLILRRLRDTRFRDS